MLMWGIAVTTSVEEVLSSINASKTPSVLIIDSIQTMHHSSIPSAPGTVSQVRACAFELIQICKKKNIILIFVGHVTKDGQIAGPKVLEHMVDTVLYFEGERKNQFRIIRSVKNRYGGANEVGIFEMLKDGLKEVQNPSGVFLGSQKGSATGSCIFAGIEGTRPMLFEIQALVVSSFLPTPRRAVVGWDSNRLAMMIAILNARFGLNIVDKEVYLNVVGGLKVTETAADLAVIAALISAARNISLSRNTVFLGEVGLSGEVLEVSQMESRLKEAANLGFEKAIIPAMHRKNTCNIEQISVKHIDELKGLL